MHNTKHLIEGIRELELLGELPYPQDLEQEFDWLETKFNRDTPQQDAELRKVESATLNSTCTLLEGSTALQETK